MRKALILFIALMSLPVLGEPEGPVEIDKSVRSITTESNKADKVSDDIITQELFNELMRMEELLTVEQRKKLAEARRRRLEATNPSDTVKEVKEILVIDTSPSAKTKTIFLTPNTSSILSVIDSSGEPWPILHKSNGWSEAFPITELEGASNKLQLETIYKQAATNLTLILEGLDTPITLKLRASHRRYHPRPIAQLNVRGPNAKELLSYGPIGISSESALESVVLGLPPFEGAQRLNSNDPNVIGWVGKDGDMYIRTRYSPRSPRRPSAVWFGQNGYAAYRMAQLPVILMSSEDGHIKQITFSSQVADTY